MGYRVWLAAPGSYQVWLATPGDHSGDREVRNHWNGNVLQGFPTFGVVRGGFPVDTERMSYQVWLATPGRPLRRSKRLNIEKSCSTYTFLARNSGPATRGPRRNFQGSPRGPKGISKRVPDNLKSLHKRQVLQCRGEFFEF